MFPEHAMLPNKCVSNIITPQYSYSSLLVLILPAAYLLSPSRLYGRGGRVTRPRQERKLGSEALSAASVPTQQGRALLANPPGASGLHLLQSCCLAAVPTHEMKPSSGDHKRWPRSVTVGLTLGAHSDNRKAESHWHSQGHFHSR